LLSVVFRGFSWHNMFPDDDFHRPASRRHLPSRSVNNAIGADVPAIYQAMF
jgi:hypothetical protein